MRCSKEVQIVPIVNTSLGVLSGNSIMFLGKLILQANRGVLRKNYVVPCCKNR